MQNKMSGKVVIFGEGSHDLPSLLHPRVKVDLPSELLVKPKNRMVGTVEIVPPEVFVARYDVIQDAFVRSGIPKLNYGTEQDMFAGATHQEVFRSYLQFAPLDLPTGKLIKRAEVVLSQLNSGRTQSLSLFEVMQGWTEKGITWENQPSVTTLLKTFTTDVQGEVRVDVTALVKDWYTGVKDQGSFSLRATDEAEQRFKQFGTRESNRRPYLEVEYYDASVYSYGKSQVPAEVFVQGSRYSDLPAQVEVRPVIWDAELPSSVRVRNPLELESEVLVSRPSLGSSIAVSRRQEESLASEVTVLMRALEDLEGFVSVTRTQLGSEVYVKYQSSLESQVDVVAVRTDDLRSALYVSRPDVPGELYVGHSYDLPSQVLVYGSTANDLPSAVVVSKPSLPGDVSVMPYVDMAGQVAVQVTHSLELLSEIKVSLPYLPSQVVVARQGYDNLPSELAVRAETQADLPGTLSILGWVTEDLPSRVVVYGESHHDLAGSVLPRVRGADDLHSQVDVHHVADLPSSVVVALVRNVDLQSSIFVYSTGSEDLCSTLQPVVRKDLPANVFIKPWNKMTGVAVIYGRGDSSLPGTIEVVDAVAAYVYIM